MKDKLIIAWKMNTFINSSRNPKNKKMLKKCLRTYIIHCIVFGKDKFKVKFGSEYYDSFKSRFKDWVEYAKNKFFDIPVCRLIPKEHRPSIINYYIEHGISKPVHIKHHMFVSESILEYFLSESGFEIYDEHLGSLETTYYIKKKERETK